MPTSWSRRRGSATTPIPPCGSGSSRCATRAATSCARPAIPTSSSATWSRRSRSWPSGIAATSTGRPRKPRSWPGRTSRRPGRSSPRTVHGRSTCWGSPASSSSTRSTTAGCATGSTRVISTSPTGRRGRTTGGWSSSARSIPGCWRRATCRWSTSTGRRPWPVKPSPWGRRRCWWRRGARPGTRRRTSPSTRCGPRRRTPASRWCSTSVARATSSSRATSTTGCRCRRTSTAARRTSARSTTWASRTRRPRRWRR